MNRTKLTPSSAVRAFCIGCLGLPRFNAKEIKNCQGDQAMCGPCPLFPYRLGRRVSVKVLRKFCLQCQGGERRGVEDCPTEDCPLVPFRFGTNPSRCGVGASGELMQAARESRKNVLESIFSTGEGKGPRRRRMVGQLEQSREDSITEIVEKSAVPAGPKRGGT